MLLTWVRVFGGWAGSRVQEVGEGMGGRGVGGGVGGEVGGGMCSLT
jgi:hypothetical protein